MRRGRAARGRSGGCRNGRRSRGPLARRGRGVGGGRRWGNGPRRGRRRRDGPRHRDVGPPAGGGRGGRVAARTREPVDRGRRRPHDRGHLGGDQRRRDRPHERGRAGPGRRSGAAAVRRPGREALRDARRRRRPRGMPRGPPASRGRQHRRPRPPARACARRRDRARSAGRGPPRPHAGAPSADRASQRGDAAQRRPARACALQPPPLVPRHRGLLRRPNDEDAGDGLGRLPRVAAHRGRRHPLGFGRAVGGVLARGDPRRAASPRPGGRHRRPHRALGAAARSATRRGGPGGYGRPGGAVVGRSGPALSGLSAPDVRDVLDRAWWDPNPPAEASRLRPTVTPTPAGGGEHT